MTQALVADRRRVLGTLAAAGAAALLRPRARASAAQPALLTGRSRRAARRCRWSGSAPGSPSTSATTARARCLRGGHARVLRGRRADDRFLADVRLLAAGDRLRPRQARQAGELVLGRQGLDLLRRARARARSRASRRHWGVPRFDLLQVHNLLAWEEHLPTLIAMKAAGQVRYVGITTSEGRRHARSRRSCAASRSTSCR